MTLTKNSTSNVLPLNSKVGYTRITIALSTFSHTQFPFKHSKTHYGDYSSITFFPVDFIKLNLFLKRNAN